MDPAVQQQKALSMMSRLESSHLALWLTRALMGNLGAVIRVVLGVMPRAWQRLAHRWRIASQLIRYDGDWL